MGPPRTGSKILERIRAFLHKHDSSLALDDDTLLVLLRQGRFLLLIDGLNELLLETSRTQLSSFRQHYTTIPMIFTTQALGLGGTWELKRKRSTKDGYN